MYLAASGYYREAWATLRQEMDLVLWEWSVAKATAPRDADKALRFEEGAGSGVHWKSVEPLFDLPEVREYRAFVEGANIKDSSVRQRLLDCVDATAVSKLRLDQHDAVHGNPRAWNIIAYPDFMPLTQFAADAFREWADAFIASQRAMVTWRLLMYPELMRWSVATSLEQCAGDPTTNHDVWLQPVMHNVQAAFFSVWRPTYLPSA